MGTIEQAAPPSLHVDLTMTAEMCRSLAREAGALEVARSFVIDSPEMAEAANGELKSIKARIQTVKKWRDGFIEPARQIMENAKALFNPGLQALEASEAHLKTALLTWTSEQERIAAEARRKAEEEARKARQEAEAKAAAERAKAEEQAREQRRLAQEAEERRLAAEREGNARAAAAAAAERAKAEEKAASVVENAEAKAQEAILTAAAAPAAIAPEPQKLDGFSTRQSWTAELAPGKTEEQAVLEIAHEIAAGRRDLAALLKLDMSAAAKLAKALKHAFNVPCMTARAVAIAASRK